MKTYMTDRRIPRRNGTWYTPYQQDADDIAARKRLRSSYKTKAAWILIWFFLLAVFW